jgi:uncharacterized Zn finger protein
MGEICCDAKAIIVNYRCDICNSGLVHVIDHDSIKNDDGEYHALYTYRCDNCGSIETIEDKIYPYVKYVQIGELRTLTEEEKRL